MNDTDPSAPACCRPPSLLSRLLLAAVVLAALLAPIGIRSGSRVLPVLEDLAHLPLGALLCLLVSSPGSGSPPGRLLARLLVALGLLEVIQPLVGRTASWADLGYGLAGGVCLLLVRSRRRPAAMLVILAALFPLGAVVLDTHRARAALPLLASFESRLELGRWVPTGSRITRTRDGATHGSHALRIEPLPGSDYPGAFLEHVPPDWSGHRALAFDARLDSARSVPLVVRVDDSERQPPYRERGEAQVQLAPGTNTVTIPLDVLLRGPGGRELEAGRIARVGTYFLEADTNLVLTLDHLRLLPGPPPEE